MKALCFDKPGGPKDLYFSEIERPQPKKGQVLIEVSHCAFNGSDKEFLLGSPAYARIFRWVMGNFKVLGSDVSGIVTEVGEGVNDFKPGDEVIGDSFELFGGLAEYCLVKASVLVKKPQSLPFEKAACVPQAGVIAVQCCEHEGGIKAGMEVLVVGAGGSSGIMAIQVAKKMGARVTAVDRSEKLDIMRKAGADDTIDYLKENYTQSGKSFDFIIDYITPYPVGINKKVLKKDGIYGTVGGRTDHLFGVLLKGPFISGKKMSVVSHKQNQKEMSQIANMMANNELDPFISTVYDFEKAPTAFGDMIAGKPGRIVIKVNDQL